MVVISQFLSEKYTPFEKPIGVDLMWPDLLKTDFPLSSGLSPGGQHPELLNLKCLSITD